MALAPRWLAGPPPANWSCRVAGSMANVPAKVPLKGTSPSARTDGATRVRIAIAVTDSAERTMSRRFIEWLLDSLGGTGSPEGPSHRQIRQDARVPIPPGDQQVSEILESW